MTHKDPAPQASQANADATGPRGMRARVARQASRLNTYLHLVMLRSVSPFGIVRKARAVYRREGVAGLRLGFLKLITAIANDRKDYAKWMRRYGTLDDRGRAMLRADCAALKLTPLISVVMPTLPTHNPPLSFLNQAIWSMRRQLYPHWELCIAYDASTDPQVRQVLERHVAEEPRIRAISGKQNGSIATSTNSALSMAQGEFVALFDHDDLLSEDALYWMADAINRQPDAGLVYSDEDKVDGANLRFAPHFKPDLNYELLLALNYISHLGLYRTALVRQLGGFRTGFDGAQEHDLVLRVIEQLTPAQVVHVPRVLYHRRAVSGSTALAAGEKDYAAEAGRKAVQEHLERVGIAAEVLPSSAMARMNRVRFALPTVAPLVSIIIPTRDRADLLGMCLDSLVQRTTYPNYEVVIVDNGSVEAATRALFARLPPALFRIVRDDGPFNFSALNNVAARLAKGSMLCLMNNDIEILTPDWLEDMLGFAARPDVGCVGARLWYPDGRLQHAGVVLGIGGIAGHAHKLLPKGDAGYFGRAVAHQSYSVVTAACLLVRRDVFEQVGGLDEELAIAFNDVDFCLRVRAAGYRNVWTPYAEMVHHESASRGGEDTPAKQERFATEAGFVRRRWGTQLDSDPAYNVNLSVDYEDFSYAWPPRRATVMPQSATLTRTAS
jgi:GT2 family glycosyltransferase